MTSITKPLAAMQVAKLTKPGMHLVGGVHGLYLKIGANGSRSWVLRITFRGRRTDRGLGSASVIGLADAREKAKELSRAFAKGRDPKEQPAPSEAMTFKAAMNGTAGLKAAGWKGDKAKEHWTSSMERFALPVIGDPPVNEVEQSHLVRIFEPIWISLPPTASTLCAPHRNDSGLCDRKRPSAGRQSRTVPAALVPAAERAAAGDASRRAALVGSPGLDGRAVRMARRGGIGRALSDPQRLALRPAGMEPGCAMRRPTAGGSWGIMTGCSRAARSRIATGTVGWSPTGTLGLNSASRPDRRMIRFALVLALLATSASAQSYRTYETQSGSVTYGSDGSVTRSYRTQSWSTTTITNPDGSRTYCRSNEGAFGTSRRCR